MPDTKDASDTSTEPKLSPKLFLKNHSRYLSHLTVSSCALGILTGNDGRNF